VRLYYQRLLSTQNLLLVLALVIFAIDLLKGRRTV